MEITKHNGKSLNITANQIMQNATTNNLTQWKIIKHYGKSLHTMLNHKTLRQIAKHNNKL